MAYGTCHCQRAKAAQRPGGRIPVIDSATLHAYACSHAASTWAPLELQVAHRWGALRGCEPALWRLEAETRRWPAARRPWSFPRCEMKLYYPAYGANRAHADGSRRVSRGSTRYILNLTVMIPLYKYLYRAELGSLLACFRSEAQAEVGGTDPALANGHASYQLHQWGRGFLQ